MAAEISEALVLHSPLCLGDIFPKPAGVPFFRLKLRCRSVQVRCVCGTVRVTAPLSFVEVTPRSLTHSGCPGVWAAGAGPLEQEEKTTASQALASARCVAAAPPTTGVPPGPPPPALPQSPAEAVFTPPVTHPGGQGVQTTEATLGLVDCGLATNNSKTC